MPKVFLKDAYITINGTDVSNHAMHVELDDNRDEIDATGYGDLYHELLQGLGDASVRLTFFQDFAASIHDLLQPIYQSGGTAEIIVQPTSAAMGPTNPAFVIQGRLLSYPGFGGDQGDASTIDVEFRNA